MFADYTRSDIELVKRKLQSFRDPGIVRKAANIIAAMQVRSAKTRIAAQKRSPKGQRWAPWSPAYARRMQGKGGSLLKQSGALQESIRGNVENATTAGATIVVGSSLPQAVHQREFYGTDSIGRKQNRPARSYLGWSSRDMRNVKDRIIRMLKGDLL